MCLFYFIDLFIISFCTHSRAGRGNLMLSHSVPHFPPISEGIACWVAELRSSLPRHQSCLHSHFVLLRHDWAQHELIYFIIYLVSLNKICTETELSPLSSLQTLLKAIIPFDDTCFFLMFHFIYFFVLRVQQSIFNSILLEIITHYFFLLIFCFPL